MQSSSVYFSATDSDPGDKSSSDFGDLIHSAPPTAAYEHVLLTVPYSHGEYFASSSVSTATVSEEEEEEVEMFTAGNGEEEEEDMEEEVVRPKVDLPLPLEGIREGSGNTRVDYTSLGNSREHEEVGGPEEKFMGQGVGGKAGAGRGYDGLPSTRIERDGGVQLRTPREEMGYSRRVHVGSQYSFGSSRLGGESGSDTQSMSASMNNTHDPGFPMSPGSSSAISSTTSWPTPRGAAKRWGAMRNLGASIGDQSLRTASGGSDLHSDLDEKENSNHMRYGGRIYHDLPPVREPSYGIEESPRKVGGTLKAVPVQNGYDSVTNAAADTVQGLINKLSSGDMSWPSEKGSVSTESCQVPGGWINGIWGRKDVEELDEAIRSALEKEGIDAKEYFKRDYTNFPSVAHYYVNLHERLCDRLDDELIDLLVSLTGRLGEKNPLVLAMNEVITYDGVGQHNCSDGLIVDVSLSLDKDKVLAMLEKAKKDTYKSARPDSLTDSSRSRHAPSADKPKGHRSRKEGTDTDEDYTITKTGSPIRKQCVSPEMVQMQQELQGLSWVIKKPSRSRTEDFILDDQDGGIMGHMPKRGHSNSSVGATTKPAATRVTPVGPAPGVFEMREEVRESRRSLGRPRGKKKKKFFCFGCLPCWFF